MSDFVDDKLWLNSYLKELNYYDNYLKDKEIISIFFGGGTPSLADPAVIGGVIEAIAKRYSLSSDAEITMEANPTSVEASKFKSVASLGVNRLSLGVQSLRQHNLEFLGREHSAHQAKLAIELARANFSKYSFDLIYALPNQTLDEWSKELDEALALANGHLSLYQLTIEKGTKFFKAHQKNEFIMPTDELAADMYLLTEDKTNSCGYSSYEVSNYAKPGFESIHNMQYWNYGDYVGIGPGAHGRISENQLRYATQNISNPNDWLRRVEDRDNGLQRNEVLSVQNIHSERIIMGLRTNHGIALDSEINAIKLQQLLDSGLLFISNNRIIATTQGRLLLNSVISNLI